MKRIFFVLLLFLMAHASLSYAQTIKQITNNSADDDNPQINDNGYIVWSGLEGADYEIFLYEKAFSVCLESKKYMDKF